MSICGIAIALYLTLSPAVAHSQTAPAPSVVTPPALGGATAEPTFTFVDASIQIKPGSTDGADTLLLKGDRLNADDMKASLKSLEEVTPGSAIKVAFEQVRELTSGQGAGTRQWVVAARATKLPITGLGDRRITLAYTLTSAFSGHFSSAVKPSRTDVSFDDGKGFEIGIAVGPAPATGVALLSAQHTGNPQDHFDACRPKALPNHRGVPRHSVDARRQFRQRVSAAIDCASAGGHLYRLDHHRRVREDLRRSI